MKAIARATFYGYRRQPGELAAVPPQNVQVEVFRRTADTWGAMSSVGRGAFKQVTAPSAATALALTAALFEKQVTAWEWANEFGMRVADQTKAAQKTTHLVESMTKQNHANVDANHQVAVCGEIVLRRNARLKVSAVTCTMCKQHAFPVS